MIKGIVTRDDNVWQGHPDIALFRDFIYVCYRESSTHLAPSHTKIRLTYIKQSSLLQGEWSIPVTVADGHRFNCPRLSVHDNRLWLVCDVIPGTENFIASENGADTRVWIWWSEDGINWSNPIKTNIQGIVPDRIFAAVDGSYLVATHTMKYIYKPVAANTEQQTIGKGDVYAAYDKKGYLVQNIWKTSSIGSYWMGPFRVADSQGYNFCEGSIFQASGNMIGCMMRENSRLGRPAAYMLSGNNGINWGGPYKTRMFGCHRPVTGKLRSGNFLTTYREQMNSVNKPYWSKNLFACLSDKESWKSTNSFVHSVILPLDHDRSSTPDGGYTGWTQLDDNSICVVNYITDDAPKPYIRYYLIKEEEF